MGLAENQFLTPKENVFQIPIKSSFEKDGTYTNHKNLQQKVKKIQILNLQAVSIQDCIRVFKEESVNKKREHPYFKQNQFLDNKEKVW